MDEQNQPCCTVQGGSGRPWRFSIISSLVCDKAAQCEVALTKASGKTGHFLLLDQLFKLPSAFCLALHGFLGKKETRKSFSGWKPYFHITTASRVERCGSSSAHSACAAILGVLTRVLFPSASLPGGLWAKPPTGWAPGVSGCRVEFCYRCTSWRVI